MSQQTWHFKVGRPLLALLIGLTNATATFSGFLVLYFIRDEALSGATSIFIGSIASAIVLFLSTEQADLPP